MQLVCYIDRRDFPLLQQKSGYWKCDARADDIRRFLEAVGNVYVTPFVCMGVLPDGADPDDSSHALHVFGDTPVILRASLADEVQLACVGDGRKWIGASQSGGDFSDSWLLLLPAVYSRTKMCLRAHISFRIFGQTVTLTSPKCAFLSSSISVRDCPMPPPIESGTSSFRIAW